MIAFFSKILKYLTISFIICSQSSYFEVTAQFYNTGTAPFLVKWQQIKTEDFTVIFPERTDSLAYTFTKYLQGSVIQNNKWFNPVKSKPLKIVLYNQNTLSNGYVSLAPRRMELITTPPQHSYAQDWLAQLALHEYRHVLQTNTLNQGFTKGLSLFIGEIAPGLATGFLPLWYIEGDAVVAETGISSTGRGREPDFIKEIKAIELDREKRYTYDQAYLGTYRGFAPDHYRYGYQMVAWTNKTYGPDALINTLNFVGKRPFLIAPFYLGLKKNTGLSKVKLYESTFNDLKIKWSKENLSLSSGEPVVTHYQSMFVSYKYPYRDEKGNIIALRKSIDDIDRFVKINEGSEEVIFTVGMFKGDQVAYSKNYIAWEEYHADIRREQKNGSVIRIYDINSDVSYILKRKARHFSPSISKNEEKIAVINVDLQNRSSLRIYSLSNHNLLSEFYHPEDMFLSYNTWLNDSVLAVVCLGNKGKSIYTVNINNGRWTKLFGLGLYNISGLSADDRCLIFTYTLDGKQNLYVMNMFNKSVHKITDSNIGADFGILCKNGSEILYSEYDYTGYTIKRKNFQDSDGLSLKQVQPYKYELADFQSKLAGFNSQDTVIKETEFKTSKYKKIPHALNIHSWIIPFYIDVNNINTNYLLQEFVSNTYLGFNIFSQNMLSTFTSSLGYYYKNGYHHFNPIIYFTGLYPKISLEFDLGGELYFITENDTVAKRPLKHDFYKSFSTKIEFPFNFSNSRFVSNLSTGVALRYTNIYLSSPTNYNNNRYYAQTPEGSYFYRGLFTADYFFSFYLASRTGYIDINPRWGLSTYLSSLKSYKTIPHIQPPGSNILFASFYLPGFYRHHSIKFRFSTEDGLSNRISGQNLPRGVQPLTNKYDYIYSTRKYVFEYTMPLLYPDLSLGPIAYFKRIHSSLFCDYLSYYSGVRDQENVIKFSGSIYSIGAEIGIETHFLRFFIPVTPVFRYSYVPDELVGRFGFYVSTNYSF